MDSTKQAAQKLLLKNKLLFLCCILFIMSSLFLTCYLFFFRTITIDVTKNAQIAYEGESGFASVSAVNLDHNLNQRTQEFLNSITYQVSPRNQLSNGSIITITAQYDEALAAKYHIRVINETKEITVSGLVERFNDHSEMDEEFLGILDANAQSYFDKHMSDIMEEDFTQFYAGSERSVLGYERRYRVFLQALDRSNKDKIVDVYEIYGKGMVNRAADREDLEEQTSSIYYMVTYDDINTAKKIRDENVFGEKVLGIEVNDTESLTQLLHLKFLLSYHFTVME